MTSTVGRVVLLASGGRVGTEWYRVILSSDESPSDGGNRVQDHIWGKSAIVCG